MLAIDRLEVINSGIRKFRDNVLFWIASKKKKEMFEKTNFLLNFIFIKDTKVSVWSNLDLSMSNQLNVASISSLAELVSYVI